MNLSSQDWLTILRTEYLDDFVRAGGAAVKYLVVADEADRAALRAGMRAAAEENGFQFAFVDAVSTRVHMIDQVFHEVARQVDWEALCYEFLARTLEARGLNLPARPDDFALSTLAQLNSYPELLLETDIERWVHQRIYQDYDMAQEFRLAVIRLCMARLDPPADPDLAQAAKEWLRGELRLISSLKRVPIFQKIARHNARHMLLSLPHWLRHAGKSGLVLVLDISRCLEAPRRGQRDEGVYYSTGALLDAYELLRQFIDTTDELSFCFVGVVSTDGFLADERRGYRRYDALYLRLADEVRDRYRQNPLSSLVRVAGEGHVEEVAG